jgi:hypothetical protein
MVMVKDLGGGGSGIFRSTVPAFSLRDREKPQEPSVRVGVNIIPTETEAEYIGNEKQPVTVSVKINTNGI